MRSRFLIPLFGALCGISLMMSCGGGGGGGGTPVAPCNNCISADTTSVAFGDVLLNGFQEKTVLIQNTGSDSLIIGQIAGSNPVAAPFQVLSDGCSNTTMAKSQICTLKVRFSPTVQGSGLGDTFDIPSNDPNTVTVSVSGNGIAPPTPAPPVPPPPASINVDPTVITFGDVVLNTPSDRTITVKNTGTLNLEIGAIAQANPLAAPFAISSDACSNSTLGANKTCALVARFSPTSPDTYMSDAFDIPSNDPTNLSVPVIVSGTGKAAAAPPPPTPPPPTIDVSSNNLPFGNIVWNSTSELTTWITNTASVGSGDLVVGQIAQTNPLAAPFSISTDNCSGKRLAPTGTCPVLVLFSPTSQGSGLSDSFDIPSNDPNRPSVRVDVGGNGRGLRVSINDVTTISCPNNIALRVSVSDKDGNPVSGLSQSNMSLSENGVSPPGGITGFSADLSPIPVSVAMVLDYSNSMTVPLPDVKSSSKGFIEQLGAGDEAAVFVFSDLVTRMQTFTDNQVALKTAVDNGHVGYFTAVNDALWSAIDNVAAYAISGNNRAIVLISDGADNRSVKTLTEVIAYAQANQVAIFTIGIGTVVTDVMTSLANETGGQYYPAPDSAQLGSIYADIRSIINGAYTVTYSSSAAPGGSALLDVFVNSGGLQGEVSRTVPYCP